MSDSVRSCRVCGCTDDDCADCIARTGRACHWVSADLCSACRDGCSALIRVRLSGSANVASVRVGGTTYRASCTESGGAACRVVAAKAAEGVRASAWRIERYRSLSCVLAKAELVLAFGGAA